MRRRAEEWQRVYMVCRPIRSIRSLPERSKSLRLNKINPISVEILEYGCLPVFLLPRSLDELNANRAKSFVISVEVISVKEEENATARLISDRILLFFSYGFRQEDFGTSPSRRFQANP